MIDRVHIVLGGFDMKKAYFNVLYVVLTLATLIVASGAPAPMSGTGTGG
jgi:hypothetical protein